MARLGIRGRVIDLYVRFVDSTGNPTNADETPEVEVFDSTGTLRQSSTNIGVSLVDDPGLYKFNYTIPETAPDGYWTAKWYAEIGNEEISNSFNFQVITSGDIELAEEPTYDPGDDVPWDFTQEEAHGINVLLKILKARVKNDGIRKVPDGSGGYIEIPCAVFTDAELICFLVNSLSSFNQTPHFTQFSFADSNIYNLFADVIIQGAVLLALAAQSLIEKGREFSFNDNGVTYQPPQIADILNGQYNTQLADYKEKLKFIKCNLKPSPLGCGTYRMTSMNPNFMRLRHLRARQIY